MTAIVTLGQSERLSIALLAPFDSYAHFTPGIETADRFLDGIDEALGFIAKMPQACAVAHDLKTIAGLEDYEFRKWRVNGFPHSIFFRVENDDTLMLQAIYAYKMNVLKRFPSEINVMSGEGL